MKREEVARLIDHTLLRPETTEMEVEQLCREAIEHRFATVCVMPYWVTPVRRRLAENESTPRICTVIGFPLGAHVSEIKIAESERALADGASELDMVMNVGALLSGTPKIVCREIEEIARLTYGDELLLKVILETSLLSPGQIVEACRIAEGSGADFVKTSTGFSSQGATEDNVKLMRRSVSESVGVKASGGIGSGAEAIRMIRAGATRIGTSRSVAILDSL